MNTGSSGLPHHGASPYKSTQQSTVPGQANLSVVGREIMSSQIKPKPTQPVVGNNLNSNVSRGEVQAAHADDSTANDSLQAIKRRNQTSSGLPIDGANGLVFGFLEEDVVESLNENNQWKDRTNAMERIESKLM